MTLAQNIMTHKQLSTTTTTTTIITRESIFKHNYIQKQTNKQKRKKKKNYFVNENSTKKSFQISAFFYFHLFWIKFKQITTNATTIAITMEKSQKYSNYHRPTKKKHTRNGHKGQYKLNRNLAVSPNRCHPANQPPNHPLANSVKCGWNHEKLQTYSLIYSGR